jgi:hypothetical protein
LHNTYEYIAVYVDDLAIAIKRPKEVVDILEQMYKFKTKTCAITFHLGMAFFRDEDNTLFLSLFKYIAKLTMNYEQMCWPTPKAKIFHHHWTRDTTLRPTHPICWMPKVPKCISP